ncbi:MAG: hypothetical protein KUG77_25480 [Nannocystaceae bacterium]|nr:hypothetical protein [Nannocystaceae bacterium]
MSNQLACRRGSQIRATAAIAGLAPIQPCLDEPVAAWFLHGAQDGAVPFDHGLEARDRLLAANDCDEESEPTQDEGCISYLGCSSGYPVIWCPHEGGHDLPGGAYGQIWGFFSQFL